MQRQQVEGIDNGKCNDIEYLRRQYLLSENIVIQHKNGVWKRTPEIIEKAEKMMAFCEKQLKSKGMKVRAD